MKSLRKLSYLSLCLPVSTLACSNSDKRSGADEGDSEVVISEDSGAGDEEPWLDVGASVDEDGDDCPDTTTPNSETEFKFSVLWVANSGQGSVSKIDTIDAVELARYYTGEPSEESYGGGNYVLHSPSRTSVNLSGDVVVGNRADNDINSSFTKVIGDKDRCPDRDGDGVVRTSQGPDDILEWGTDECVDWNYKVEGNRARAVAWDAGEVTACGTSKDPAVWLGFDAADVEGMPRTGEIHLVDNYGQLIERVVVDDQEVVTGNFAFYGGAVDRDGNFFANTSGGWLRVDRETFETSVMPGGGYGMAMDKHGNAWGTRGSGATLTDVTTQEMIPYNGSVGGYLRGIVIDQEEQLWLVLNSPCGLARLDIPSGVWVDPIIELPSCEEPVGVSVDFEGHIWVVDRQTEEAYKLERNEPGNGVNLVGTVSGLVQPYTYSDMTGAVLNLVVNPPVE